MNIVHKLPSSAGSGAQLPLAIELLRPRVTVKPVTVLCVKKMAPLVVV